MLFLERKLVVRRLVTLRSLDTRIVARKMLQHVKNILRVGVDRARNFLRGLSRSTRKFFPDIVLQLEQPRCCLLSRFHYRLMVGVDVNQRAVETDGAVVERDQLAVVECVRCRTAPRDPFTFHVITRVARTPPKTRLLVAPGNIVSPSKSRTIALRRHFNKRDKETHNAIAQ